MTDEKKVIDAEKDELDNWFDEDEDDSYAYTDDDVEEEESADEESSDEESSASEEADDVPDKEVQDTGAEQATGEGTSTESQPKDDDPYAWVAELDPELRQKAERLVARDRSNAGRAAATQARLDKMLAEQEAASRVSARPAVPKKPAVSAKDVEDMDDDELKEFMEEYPNVARNVQKLIEQRTNQTREEVLAQIRPFQQQQEAARAYESKQRLRQEAEAIFNTAETGIDLDTVINSPRWKEWKDSQPVGYRKLIDSANSVEDASKVLQDFARYADEQIASMNQQAGGGDPVAQSADETAARRKQALKGGSPKSRSAEISSKGGGGRSYEDIFNEIVEASS